MVSFSETLSETITISNLKHSLSMKTILIIMTYYITLKTSRKMLFNGDIFGKRYLYKYMNKYTIICI